MTSTLVLLFTNEIYLSILIGIIDGLVKISLYFLHDQLWEKIDYGRSRIKPAVIWLTGLPGSGKSTLARALTEQLKEQGHLIQHLDHDTVKDVFPEFEQLYANSHQSTQAIGYLAHCLEKNGITVVASVSSPHRNSRDFARQICRNFREVYVSTPLEACTARDSHIKSSLARETPGSYEPPLMPDLKVNTAEISNCEAIQKILAMIRTNQQLPYISFPNGSDQLVHESPLGESPICETIDESLSMSHV